MRCRKNHLPEHGKRLHRPAHRINKGQQPIVKNSRDTDFFFVKAEEDIAEVIVDLCKRRLPAHYSISAQDIQVLTPMQKGPAGAINLNERLQAALNPSKICLRHGGIQYRLHDKVMQIRNNYDKDVFNGDIGVIVSVKAEEGNLTVDFDGSRVTYETGELDELTLSYATTIHKAQGSEFPVVVMPVTMSHQIMLQRNLLYTGVTRAKKLFVMVGEENAVRYAVANTKVEERNTRLAERLKKALGGMQ